jgi:hypothetical protein
MLRLILRVALFLTFGLAIVVSLFVLHEGPIRYHNFTYWRWARLGGERPPDWLNLVAHDYNSQSIVAGKTIDELKTIFPVLIDGSKYPKNSWRAYCLSHIQQSKEYRNQAVQLWWLDEEVQLCIVVADGKGKEIEWAKS